MVSNKIQDEDCFNYVIMVTPLLDIDSDTRTWPPVLISHYNHLKSAVARFAGKNILVAL